MSHPADAQIRKALETQKRLLAMLQEIHAGFQDPRSLSGHPWCDLAAMNEVNRRLSEACGFAHDCEGSDILETLSA